MLARESREERDRDGRGWGLRSFLTLAMILGSCSASHAHVTCDDGVCPGDLVCVRHPALPSTECVERCPTDPRFPMPDAWLWRCPNGAACQVYRTIPVCWPGGSTPDGEASTMSGFDCAFGLRGADDYTTDPLVYRCTRGCANDDDCLIGEQCWAACQPRCTGENSVPCAAPNQCVDFRSVQWCVNERRFDRIDCDGDGAVRGPPCERGSTCECMPWGECDASAIGGCAHPERGSE